MSTEIVVRNPNVPAPKSRKPRRKTQNVRRARNPSTKPTNVSKVRNSQRGRTQPRLPNNVLALARNNPAMAQVANFERRHDAYVNGLHMGTPIVNDRKIFSDYLKTLLENWACTSRYPDSRNRATAVFTSVSSFNVPLTLENSEYRFSLAVQPQMGDASTPSNFQAAIANPTTTYELADWSSSTQYVSSTNGRDPRLDINYSYLANSTPSGFHGRTQLTAAGAAQAQPNPAAGNTAGQNFQGPNLVPAPTSYTTTAAVGSLDVIQNADGSFTVPPGSYSIVLGATFTVSMVGALTNILPILVFTPSGVTVQDGTSFACIAVAAGAQGTASRSLNVVCSTPAKFYVTLTKTTVNTPIAAGDLSALTTDIIINPTNFIAPGPNNGAISMIRPVAQTILVTYMGPTLLNGGRIAGAYVPKGSLSTNFFTPSAGVQGNYQFVENLANLSGAYDGRLKDGCFGFWTPYDETDVEFQTISEMNSSQWPSMVVSGAFNPVTNLTGNLSDIVRVRLITTFEFITKSTAFEQRVCCGSQNIIDSVNRVIGGAPHFMPNATHESWIKAFLDGVLKYGPTVLKGAGLVASLL